MANWRDRRPSDDDIPSTEEFLRQFHKRGNRAGEVEHVVVRDEPGAEAGQRRDEMVEGPIWAKVLIRWDWIIAGLVCLVLILQIWHHRYDHGADGREDPPPEQAGGEEQSPLEAGSVPDGLKDAAGSVSPLGSPG